MIPLLVSNIVCVARTAVEQRTLALASVPLSFHIPKSMTQERIPSMTGNRYQVILLITQ